jgi:hypothetical protein
MHFAVEILHNTSMYVTSISKTGFYAIFFATLKHMVCWVNVNLITVDIIYTFVIISLFSVEILSKKHLMFSIVSHHGLTQTQRNLTANWAQEQTCTD